MKLSSTVALVILGLSGVSAQDPRPTRGPATSTAQGGSLTSVVTSLCDRFHANTSRDDVCDAGCHPQANAQCVERTLVSQVCGHVGKPPATCAAGCDTTQGLLDWLGEQRTNAAAGRRQAANVERSLYEVARYACVATRPQTASTRPQTVGAPAVTRPAPSGAGRRLLQLTSGAPSAPRSCDANASTFVGTFCGMVERLTQAAISSTTTTRPAVVCPQPEVVKYRIRGTRIDAKKKKVCFTPQGKDVAMVQCGPKNQKQIFTLHKDQNGMYRVENPSTSQCLKHHGKMGPCARADVFELVSIDKFNGYSLKVPETTSMPKMKGKCLQANFPTPTQTKMRNILVNRPCLPKTHKKPVMHKKQVFFVEPIF